MARATAKGWKYEAEILGRCRHRRENEQRIEPQRTERAIAQLAVELALIPVRNRQNVGEENEIEAAVFEDAADIAVVFQRQQVAVSGRVAPSAVMAGNRPRHNEGRQVHLSLFHSPAPVWAFSPNVGLGEPVGRKFRLSGRQRPWFPSSQRYSSERTQFMRPATKILMIPAGIMR
jgi:hypothetical protein